MVLIAGLLAVGEGATEMGLGWETYGQQAGYTQQQWNNLTQAQRNNIKAGGSQIGALSGFTSAPATTAAPADGTYGRGLGVLAPQQEQQYQEPVSYDGGGGGGGGGVSAYDATYDPYAVPAPAPKLLAQAPEWLAYLSSLGLQESMYKAEVDRQKEAAGAAGQAQLVNLPFQFQQQRRNITGNLEQRGMARSGEFLRRIADNRKNEGAAASAITGQIAAQQSALEAGLASRLIELQMARAQQELALRMQGYQ